MAKAALYRRRASQRVAVERSPEQRLVHCFSLSIAFQNVNEPVFEHISQHAEHAACPRNFNVISRELLLRLPSPEIAVLLGVLSSSSYTGIMRRKRVATLWNFASEATTAAP